MHRGFERRTIFGERADHERFLMLLGEMAERYRIRVHAYCLLGNHYHAISQTPDANLSQGMQWLGLSYSSWYNAKHDRVGPLFQGRFRSVPVEDGGWVYELSLYVHLNPVRTLGYGLDKQSRKVEALGLAGSLAQEEATVRLKKLREYPWSSYRAYAGYASGPAWLTTDGILRRAARAKAQRNQKYRTDARALLCRGVDPSRLEQFRDVVGIGSAEFINRIKKMAGDGERETARRGRLRERVSFEGVLSVVEDLRGEPASGWLARHGDWGKWLVLLLARRYTGMTLGQLGAQAGGIDYAAVGMGLRRFERRLRKDRKIKAVLKSASQMLDVKT
jgi:REP element-mobilizing transposase RayT